MVEEQEPLLSQALRLQKRATAGLRPRRRPWHGHLVPRTPTPWLQLLPLLPLPPLSKPQQSRSSPRLLLLLLLILAAAAAALPAVAAAAAVVRGCDRGHGWQFPEALAAVTAVAAVLPLLLSHSRCKAAPPSSTTAAASTPARQRRAKGGCC